jgi:hypothetical protein
MTAKRNLTGTDIGGATLSSAPQLDPVFSFHVEGGDVYVYLAKTEVAKFAIATYDNTSDEYAFAIQTLTSNSPFEADELIRDAEKEGAFLEDNPFSELLHNDEAMQKLANILANFFDSGDSDE